MTLSTQAHFWLQRRDSLTPTEEEALEEAITDALGQLFIAGVAMANDDRRAEFEAAFVRYIIESRPPMILVAA